MNEQPPRNTSPPPAADALLHRWLPDGILGLSIIGDLHQEYAELCDSRAHGNPDRWYWRSALTLSARYAAIRLKNRMLASRSGDSIGVMMMTTMLADVRFAFRMLIKTPMLSAIAILTIALGVGLTTHTFSSVYGTILRGLPVPGEERLMLVAKDQPEFGFTGMSMSTHELRDLREQQTTFEDLAALYRGTVNVAGARISEFPPLRPTRPGRSRAAARRAGAPTL